jgi:monooxygenase
MEADGATWCVARRDPSVDELPLMDFQSGYVQRSIDSFPRAGSKAPWKLKMNYAADMLALKFSSLDDGAMEFGGGTAAAGASTSQVAKAS